MVTLILVLAAGSAAVLAAAFGGKLMRAVAAAGSNRRLVLEGAGLGAAAAALVVVFLGSASHFPEPSMKPPADTLGAVALATPRVTALRQRDVAEACRLLRSEPSVCFEEWETPLVAKQAAEAPDLVPSYYRDGELLGIAVAGTFGVRGTISHVVTAPRARGLGIASHLVDSALSAMKARGIRRVFLFTTPGNSVAESFWTSRGFVETATEKTFEIDF